MPALQPMGFLGSSLTLSTMPVSLAVVNLDAFRESMLTKPAWVSGLIRLH